MATGGLTAREAVGRIEDVFEMKRDTLAEVTSFSFGGSFVQKDSQLVELMLSDIAIKEGQLKQLVTILAQCEQLQSLRLMSCQLANIEPITALTGLIKLRELDLFDNQIFDVRPIYSLLSLENLYIHSNPIESKYLKEIVRRLSLKSLALSRCGLTDCKSLIDGIQLQMLYLENNSISDISPLQYLAQLKRLDIGGNDITAIPKWVLIRDWAVSLEDDHSKLLDLGNHVTFANNPITTPPLEIAQQGNEAIVNYYQQLDKSATISTVPDYLFEAKMLVVGEPGAGKTSLVRKLENPKAQLPEDSETTKGIDVLRYDFEIHQSDFPNFSGQADIEGCNFRVNLWDFGGQEIYLATHRFFLSKRALYAVVSDSRKEDTDFNYWLHIVEMFADNSPVLIILNQKDGREHQLDSGALRARFNNIRDIKTVNLADDDHTRLKQIQQIIRHEISQLDHIGSPLPNTWLQVREQLENTPKNVIKPHEYLDICLSCGIDDEQDAMTLSQYFHDIGVFLHFHDDAVLKNIIFLKPNWATNAIYQVLDDAVIFDNKGLLSKTNIRNIWQDGELEKYCDEFLKLMEKFHLALKIQASDNYIVPAKLPTEAPSYGWSAYNNLNFRYQYDEFMPKGILFHLMVELQHLITNHANVWRRGMLVEKNGATTEISETYLSKAIHIRINAINNSDASSLRDLLIIIMDKLDVINSQYNHLKVEKLVPCHCSECKGIEEPFFYKYSSLQKRKQKNIAQVQCDNSYEMLNVNALLNAVMDEQVNQANECEFEFKTKERAVVRDQIFIRVC